MSSIPTHVQLGGNVHTPTGWILSSSLVMIAIMTAEIRVLMAVAAGLCVCVCVPNESQEGRSFMSVCT